MKVLVFGAGDFGIRFLSDANVEHTVVGFLDNNKKLHGRYLFGKYKCHLPQEVNRLQYDKIIITSNIESPRSRIHEQMLSLGVSEDKIEFYPPTIIKDDSIDLRIPFYREFSEIIQLNNTSGSVAECGVYKGDSAMYINRYFPDKKLYLFDTFEGFREQDIIAERALNNSEFVDGGFTRIGGWKITEDFIINKMPFPENVTVIKGYIPETLEGIDDSFCFINLDMDLYQPMLAAMKFFWEKMTRNGGILVHDYYDITLPGVKKAVHDFETSLGHPVNKAPTADCLLLLKD